jgi:hypothetical protein
VRSMLEEIQGVLPAKVARRNPSQRVR